MLVLDDSRSLVLKLKDPSRVTSVIPTAKVLEFNGHRLTVVPHKLDETKVLRNLGIKAPAPILHYYKWSGRYTPYEHQRKTAAFLTMHQRALVLNEIGTGKSVSALWAADYLMKQKLVRKVLILSPLSTLERVWGDAVFTDFPHRQAVVLHGSAKRRLKLLNSQADFYIINHDGLKVIAPEVKGQFDLMIVDEAAVLRNPSTDRFKVAKKIIDQNPDMRVWLMTGTPTPNEPTDAWALAKLVGSPKLTKSYTAFRDSVMMKVGEWRYIPKPTSADTVKEVLTPAIRFTREECLDLPDTVFQSRRAALSPEQEAAFKRMLKHFVVEAEQGKITAANEAVKMQKLVQIACGVAYDDQGNDVELPCGPRVAAVEEIIEEAGGKVIVFVPLTGALNMLVRELGKRWTVACVNGQVPAPQRNEIFRAFQHDPDPKILIAHPATMAHGLTLTSASTIVWYGPVGSNEQYTQANGRIERIGKNKTSLVVHVESTDIERRMYDRLKGKQRLQGLLLDLIQQETGK